MENRQCGSSPEGMDKLGEPKLYCLGSTSKSFPSLLVDERECPRAFSPSRSLSRSSKGRSLSPRAKPCSSDSHPLKQSDVWTHMVVVKPVSPQSTRDFSRPHLITTCIVVAAPQAGAGEAHVARPFLHLPARDALQAAPAGAGASAGREH